MSNNILDIYNVKFSQVKSNKQKDNPYRVYYNFLRYNFSLESMTNSFEVYTDLALK